MIGRKPPPSLEEPASPRGFDTFEMRLGDLMRGERATMGKSLLDVQRELRIKATYIAAIENSDASAFETPGFIAGYVRSYARYLGLDPEWAFRTFCVESNFTQVHGMSAEASRAQPVRPTHPGRDAREARDPLGDPNATFFPKRQAGLPAIQPGALGSVFVLLLLIGGIGYGGWSVLREIQRVQFAPVEQAPGVVSELDPLEEATALAQNETTSDGPGMAPPTTEMLDRLYRPPALDVPVLTARDGPIATLDPRSVGALAPNHTAPSRMADAGASDTALPDFAAGIQDAIAQATGGTPVQVVEQGVPEVVMLAVRPAWVRVRAVDGTVIFEKIMEAGERYVLPQTEEPPTLRAGNSGSVYFAVNGETYGPAGAPGSVAKNVTLAAETLKSDYQLADLDADRDLATLVAEASAQP